MKYTYVLLFLLLVISCGNSKKTATTSAAVSANVKVGPVFSADSAYAFCAEQCAFGPRTMNSEGHDKCGQWIQTKFKQYGMQVQTQQAVLKLYDGTPVNATNIIASYKPDEANRILLCAHWDTRPWSDNDPNEANWHTPVDGANDGASGVAVLLEVARLLNLSDSLALGVDFICFDAEDSGYPQWANGVDPGNTWALGSQHWAANLHKNGYMPRFGILLDMVGGQGAKFYKEGFSVEYASNIVDKVWTAAHAIGYGSRFPMADGGYITDAHVPCNELAHIPVIDIVPYYPDCPTSNFGPTWHTVNDNMANIDRTTLEAVGQTIVQVLFSEK